jgi:ATP-binding cassette subfamily B protein
METLFYLKSYWKEIIIVLATLALATFADILIPSQIQRVIDEGIMQNDMQVVIIVSLLMIGMSLLSMLFTYISTIYSIRVSENFAADLRAVTFKKTQEYSFSNLDNLHTSELLVRLTSDINIIKNATMMTLRMVVRAPLMLIGSLVMLLATNLQLSIILAVLFPLLIILIVYFSKRSGKLNKAVQSLLDRVNMILQENIEGVQVVKAFVRSDHEIERFKDKNEKYMEKSIQVNQLTSMLLPLLILVLNLGIVAIYWAGGTISIQGGISTGELVAFSNYLLISLISVLMMGMVLPQLFASDVSLNRVYEAINVKPAITEKSDAFVFKDVEGNIKFDNVSFYYNDNGKKNDPVLENISFEVEAGETVAIIGGTGSGKTTLINLIPRFYDVSSGNILIDGIDIRDVTLESLRETISVCLQETVLFSGTLKENIRFGNRLTTEDEIVLSAEIADAKVFIDQKPDAYDSRIGERGVGLSGGQKQRLAIARAVARKPKILIMDDSTSAVDATTEAHIHDSLKKEMDGITQIIVAQRISTVLTTDKIIVLDNGKISGIGDHESLLAANPIYQEIYTSQLGNNSNV